MQTVLIAIHLLIVLALVVVVLLQRSEGGGLGMGGGSGGGLMTARGAANMLTRTTAILATLFFITSMALAILARYGTDPLDILNRVPAGQSAPATTPGANGSLLDQLGGLPEQAPASNGVPAGGSAASGTTPTVPATPAPAQNESGVPTGAAPATIPANPAPQAPNAETPPTVAPVESPAPGAADNGAPNASPAQPAQ